jgi:nucleoside phosphorylase
VNRILFVFATVIEAAPFLENALPVSAYFYQSHRGDVLVTGMGSSRIEERLEPCEGKYDEVWNLGFAGGLSEKVSFGDVYRVSFVNKYPTSETCDLSLEGKGLITVDKPLYDVNLRDQLSAHWDLVDMEGFAIASVVKKWGIPCHLVKIVSDKANEEASKTIRENASFLAKKLHSSVS